MHACWLSDFWFETNEEVACELETQPTASHTRGDLEEVRCNTLVQTLDTFMLDNDSDGIEDRFVLVAHPRHGVDLESASKQVTADLDQ